MDEKITATHRLVAEGYNDEPVSVEFEGTAAECAAELAAHKARYPDIRAWVRAVPGTRAVAKKQSARAELFSSFGLPAVSTTQVVNCDDRTGWSKTNA